MQRLILNDTEAIELRHVLTYAAEQFLGIPKDSNIATDPSTINWQIIDRICERLEAAKGGAE